MRHPESYSHRSLEADSADVYAGVPFGDGPHDPGLRNFMFPVRRVDVFAEIAPGDFRRFPGRKALVNGRTGQVLAVVSDRYQVLPNQAALDIAIRAGRRAFPNEPSGEWYVSAVGGAGTGGHCWFDLQHPSFPQVRVSPDDIWELSVRVTNSYNHTRAFSLQFAFVRLECENRVLVREGKLLKVSVDHSQLDIVRKIEARIAALDFRTFGHTVDGFHEFVLPLTRIRVARHRFRPIVQSVLKIRSPDGMEPDDTAWHDLCRAMDATRDRYIGSLDETAYALFNTISDVATRPEKHDRGRFVRRDRYTLQKLAGDWLSSFHKLSQDGAGLKAYLESPSWSTLLGGDNADRRR